MGSLPQTPRQRHGRVTVRGRHLETNTEVTPPRSPVPEVTLRQAQVTEPQLAEVTLRPQEVTGPRVTVTDAVPGPPSTCISRSRSRWTLVALSPLSSPLGPSPSSCLSGSS